MILQKIAIIVVTFNVFNIFACTLIQANPFKKDETIFLNDRYKGGMFSDFLIVLGALKLYDENKCAGVVVDFDQRGLYYDKTVGKNWWTYYFAPIKVGSLENLKEVSLSDRGYLWRIAIADYAKTAQLIAKYIIIKEHILNKVNAIVSEKFSGYTMIGVHCRRTDKLIKEAPFIADESFIQAINEYIEAFGKEQIKLFIATDDENFIETMRQRYGDKVISLDMVRSKNSEPLHHHPSNPYQSGEEAIIDCLLLSACDALVASSSNLNTVSSILNPAIPVTMLRAA